MDRSIYWSTWGGSGCSLRRKGWSGVQLRCKLAETRGRLLTSCSAVGPGLAGLGAWTLREAGRGGHNARGERFKQDGKLAWLDEDGFRLAEKRLAHHHYGRRSVRGFLPLGYKLGYTGSQHGSPGKLVRHRVPSSVS
jgi:hypothetical protein